MSEVTVSPTTTTTTDDPTARRAARYAGFVFWVLFLANFFNYLERFIFAGITPYIKIDLGFNDAQIGLLGSIFFLAYTVFALPFGFLGERLSRKSVFSLGMAIAGIATVLTGIFYNFTALIGIKTLFGLGQSGFYPTGTPFLVAHYPPSQRAKVLSRWGVGALIGAAVGFLLAGAFKAPYAWRTALYIVGAPAVLVAVVVLVLREKFRHEADPATERLSDAGSSVWSRMRGYLRIPTFRVIIATHALGFFALTGISFWLPIFLQDTYGQSYNLTDASGNQLPTKVNTYFGAIGLDRGLVPVLAGAIVLIGGLLGILYGSRLATQLSRRRSGARVLAGGIGFLLAAPCVLIATGSGLVLPHVPAYASLDIATQFTVGLAIFCVFALLAAFFLNVYSAPTGSCAARCITAL